MDESWKEGIPIPGVDKPRSYRVAAPNGNRMKAMGWLIFGSTPLQPTVISMFLVHVGTMRQEKLSPYVVVQDGDTGKVLYHPRRHAERVNELGYFMGPSEERWLRENSHWPAVLELDDNPVQ